MSIRKIFIYCCFILFIFVTKIFAADPSISGTSGAISDGETVVISGSNFGTKSTAAPAKYDDFEQIGGNYDVGDQIANGWNYRTGSTNDIVKYNNSNVRNGSTKHVRNKVYEWGPGRFWYTQAENLTELYVTYWYKLHMDYGEECGGSKFFAVYSAVPPESGSWTMPNYDALADVGIGWYYMNMRDENGNWIVTSKNWEGGAFPEDRWIRLEYYIKESSFNGQEDGILRVWAHRNPGVSAVSLEKDINCATNCDGCSNHFKTVVFSLWFYTMGDCNRVIDHDDIYIDNTQARVEIGDNGVWANCSHREIQIPSAWADDEITITINAGSFTDLTGGGCYLFVLDLNGEPSDGHQLTGGEGGGTGEPTVSGGGMSGGNW